MVTQVLTQGKSIEQRLSGMFVRSIPRVNHVGIHPVGVCQPMRSPRHRVPNDHCIRTHGGKRQRGVFQTLAFAHARTLGGKVDDVSREALCRSLKRDAGTRGVFKEQVHDRAPTQGGHLFNRHIRDASQLLGRIENLQRGFAIEVSGREQVRLHLGIHLASTPKTTES